MHAQTIIVYSYQVFALIIFVRYGNDKNFLKIKHTSHDKIEKNIPEGF